MAVREDSGRLELRPLLWMSTGNAKLCAMDTVIDPRHFVCNSCRCLHKRELLKISTFSLERQA